MFSNKERIESFIGKNSKFKGDVVTKGTIKVDGRFVGNIEADWIILGDKGFIKGNLSAGGIIVGGIVEGTIKAKELVDIQRKGRIKGDITTAKLTVADGGVMDGRVTMSAETSKIIELTGSKLREIT